MGMMELPVLECTVEAVSEAIAAYAQQLIHPAAPVDFANPDHVYNVCGTIRGFSRQYSNVHLWFLEGKPENFPRSKWTKHNRVPHYVCTVGDPLGDPHILAVDLTHRQIDSEGPVHWVGPWREYFLLWETCDYQKRSAVWDNYQPGPLIPEWARQDTHVRAYHDYQFKVHLGLMCAPRCRKKKNSGDTTPRVSHLRKQSGGKARRR